MATGGHKPGISAKVRVIDIVRFGDPSGTNVNFNMAAEDGEYFTVGKEYVAFFMPAPPDNPPGGGNEQGNG